MLKTDPAFPPPDPQARIWRFMDLAELVSLLSKRALFFSRADKLDDPFEGSLPKLVVAKAEKGFEKLTLAGQEIMRDTRQNYGYLQSRLWTMVNCWYASEHESAAMWKLHASEGVSIQSTFQRFVDALSRSTQEIFVGKVRYLDYETEAWDVDHDQRTILSVFHKRKSFEHEHELRAVISEPLPGGIYNRTDGPGYLSPTGMAGVYVDVDVARLVETIRVAPGSPPWFRDVVQTVAGLADLGEVVSQSRLDDEPVW